MSSQKVGKLTISGWALSNFYGSTNGHLAPRDVGRVLVPRLKRKIENRISGLVEGSLKKRAESEKLIDQAKIRVEQLIEEAVQS